MEICLHRREIKSNRIKKDKKGYKIKMKIKFLVDEDFLNYKKASMFIGFPNCSLKCDAEAGTQCCQNSSLFKQPNIEIKSSNIIKRYMSNPITSSVVFGGLEPFDSWEDISDLIKLFREQTEDDIVIYTGYKEDEIEDKINYLKQYKNIIVKFGRFVPNQEKHKDSLLGIYLASPNQYAVKIS